MSATMTSRERLLRAARRQVPDRLPIAPRDGSYIAQVEGCSCWMHQLRFHRQLGIDTMIVLYPRWSNYLFRHGGPYDDLPDVTVEMEIVNGEGPTLVRRRFRTPAGELTDLRQLSIERHITFDHIVEHLVKGREDVEKLLFILPDPRTASVADIVVVKEIVGEQGVVECRPTVGTDQFLADAVGVERCLLMYYDDRKLLAELLRLFNGYTQALMTKALEAGIELIFDPWYNCGLGVGWSPGQWRELFLPHIRANAELVHRYGALYHYYDDGKMDQTLDALAGAGVDIVETLTPPPMGDVDLAAAKARVGGRVCLKGYVDQVNVILPGPPEAIREEVRRVVEIGAPGGGFILSTADSIRPETPSANANAYYEAAREFAGRAYRG